MPPLGCGCSGLWRGGGGRAWLDPYRVQIFPGAAKGQGLSPEDGFSRKGWHTYLPLCEGERLNHGVGVFLLPEGRFLAGEMAGLPRLLPTEAVTPIPLLLFALSGLTLCNSHPRLCFSLLRCKCQKCQFYTKSIGGLFDL